MRIRIRCLPGRRLRARTRISLDSQPLFVDRDGADNVFGFAQVNSVFVDGGADDNFYLRAGSPGIDSGYSWSYAVDAERFVRRDDPVTANSGSTEYFQATLGSSLFAATGTSLSFSSIPALRSACRSASRSTTRPTRTSRFRRRVTCNWASTTSST